jgi:hypothetical protein
MIRSLAFALLFAACAPSTRVITVPVRTLDAAPAGSVTLVVANDAGWRALNLLDENGKVVGQLSGRSVTSVVLRAGRFTLYAVPDRDGERGARFEGRLEAGQALVLVAGVRPGGVALTASPSFDEALDPVALDPTRVAALQDDLGDIRPVLTAVDARMGQDPATITLASRRP